MLLFFVFEKQLNLHTKLEVDFLLSNIRVSAFTYKYLGISSFECTFRKNIVCHKIKSNYLNTRSNIPFEILIKTMTYLPIYPKTMVHKYEKSIKNYCTCIPNFIHLQNAFVYSKTEDKKKSLKISKYIYYKKFWT